MTVENEEAKDTTLAVLKRWSARIAAFVAVTSGILTGLVTVLGKWEEVKTAFGWTSKNDVAEVSGPPIRESSPGEISSALSRLTPAQRSKAFAATYAGRVVYWTGKVVRIKPLDDQRGYLIDVAVAATDANTAVVVPQARSAAVEQLREQDEILVHGRIEADQADGIVNVSATSVFRLSPAVATPSASSSTALPREISPPVSQSPVDPPAEAPETPATQHTSGVAAHQSDPAAANRDTTPAPTDASMRNYVRPRYPPRSVRLGQQGVTTIRVLVGADGVAKAAEIEKSSGFPELDAAAAKALRESGFNPATKDGSPVESYILVPIKFSLSDL